MRWLLATAGVVAGTTACGDAAILVTVDGDLSVPAQIDGVCLHVADTDDGGGEFGRFYRLEGDLASLPQTLAVEPGSASAARITARGYHAGVEVARAGRDSTFSGNVTLALDRCVDAASGEPSVRGMTVADAGTRVAVSWGRGGSRIVAIGSGGSAVLRATGDGLQDVPDAAPAASADGALLLAFDADGDCDDDVLVALPATAPTLWRREGVGQFVEDSGALADMPPVVAAVNVDVDADGDLDVIVGGGGTLGLWRNDGAGRFTRDAAALSAADLTDVTALAAGDIDGDGRADLVVGQGGAAAAPAAVFFGDASGTGFFVRSTAALPELPMQARSLALVDVTGDALRDLLVASADGPVRLYVNRGDGRLEDRSFVSLPNVEPVDARSAVAGDWDGDCIPDAVIGLAAAGAPLAWRGTDGGGLVSEGLPDVVGEQVVLADVDDDGDRDLIIAGSGQVLWLAR